MNRHGQGDRYLPPGARIPPRQALEAVGLRHEGEEDVQSPIRSQARRLLVQSDPRRRRDEGIEIAGCCMVCQNGVTSAH